MTRAKWQAGSLDTTEALWFFQEPPGTHAQPRKTKFWQVDLHTKTKHHGSHILDSRIKAGYDEKCSDGKRLRQSWFAVADFSFHFASLISDLVSLDAVSPNKYHVLTFLCFLV